MRLCRKKTGPRESIKIMKPATGISQLKTTRIIKVEKTISNNRLKNRKLLDLILKAGCRIISFFGVSSLGEGAGCRFV
jgi:hypothetical protein